MDAFQYEFSAKVDVHDFGRMAYTVVDATEDIARKLALQNNPRLRISGTVAGHPFHGAFQPTGGKRYYLILSKKFCRSAGLTIGDELFVCFDVADQDAVDVPKHLEFALNANDLARRAWDSLTPGKQRGYAYRVSSAKRIETIENRVEEVIETLIAIEKNATQQKNVPESRSRAF